MSENLINKSLGSRSNLTAFDSRPNSEISNVGQGITATLTGNIFNKSFPDWVKKAAKFNTFLWAPRKVVGAGVKNIQWGTKETETYTEYKVGDLIHVKIKDRPKVYESRVGDLKIKIQVSLDIPPHGHVDKFIDIGEYVQFMNDYTAQLAQAMGKTTYELFRGFFISSAFGTCLPTNEFDKLLLRTLAKPDGDINRAREGIIADTIAGVGNYSPLTNFMLKHADAFKALADEMNKKITNKYVYDCHDIVFNNEGTFFDPFKPGNPKGVNQMDGMKRLANALICNPTNTDGVSMPSGQRLPNGRGPRLSRTQCLKAFETVLADIAGRTGIPSHLWGQGNCGNITGKNIEDAGNDDNGPVENDRYPANKGTTIMDKPMSKRPMLVVECEKENRILVMSSADYRDFTSGAYQGVFGENTTYTLNFDRVSSQFSEIITVDDLPCGHAIIMDKRMLCCIPHLEASGTDSIVQRLVTVNTMHKGLIFGLFDQFVGVRIQMVSYTGSPIDMNNIFIANKDIQLFTNVR